MGNIIKLTESELVRIINRVISEEKNDDIYDFIIDYITNQLSGLKKNKSGGWSIDGKHMMNYSNRSFIIDYRYFREIQKTFNLSESEVGSLYYKVLSDKFPRYKIIQVIPS